MCPHCPLVAVLGEVDLSGRLRSVGQIEQRLAEVAQLGYCDTCIVPKVRLGVVEGERHRVDTAQVKRGEGE